MRKWVLVVFSIALLATAFALAGAATGDIRNSHHDFSRGSWSGDEICVPCHTPHHADTSVTAAPLWNHEVTTASYQVYSSPTLDASPGQAGGVSKLCLSCHDGTVAIDSFGGESGSRNIQNWADTGTDLSRHHPISFIYDSTLATTDGELWDPDATSTGLGGTITTDLLSEGGRLECSSCHDVHVARNTQGCSGCHSAHGPDLTPRTLSLRIDNTNSEFCLTCHKK